LIELFVPGRICLFGEHSDWAGEYRRIDPAIEKGRTLLAGTEQGIHARVERHPNALVLESVAGGGRHEIPMEPGALLREARLGGFWSYVAGVAWAVAQRHDVRGLVLENHRVDLPIRKGLSSSAAICVLTARAFNRLYGLGFGIREEMELAYQGEIVTPSRCGRMDQACAFGTRVVAMTFDGDEVEIEEVAPGADLALFVVDLGARKDTRLILERLHRAYPAADDPIARGVRELLGPIHAGLVERAIEAILAGDAERLGSLMVEAQERFDRLAAPACPEELRAPALHRVLGHPAIRPHVWGGKGVGSQGDGSAQFVARSATDRDAACSLVERELGMSCLPLTLGATK
jgi:mevalonate kinase